MSAKRQSWSVWMRLGVGLHGIFIEDITIYDCAEKPGYVRGTVTLVDPPEGSDVSCQRYGGGRPAPLS